MNKSVESSLSKSRQDSLTKLIINLYTVSFYLLGSKELAEDLTDRTVKLCPKINSSMDHLTEWKTLSSLFLRETFTKGSYWSSNQLPGNCLSLQVRFFGVCVLYNIKPIKCIQYSLKNILV